MIATTIADLQPEAPEPDAPARDDVLLAQLRALEAEEARPRDQAVEERGRRAPRKTTTAVERGEDRPEPRPALRLVEPDDDRGGREERDRSRGPGQAAPLAGELGRQFALPEPRRGPAPRTPSSLPTPISAASWSAMAPSVSLTLGWFGRACAGSVARREPRGPAYERGRRRARALPRGRPQDGRRTSRSSPARGSTTASSSTASSPTS